MPKSLTFKVAGAPIPKGALSYSKKHKRLYWTNSAKVKPWAKNIQIRAREAMSCGQEPIDMIDAPVSVRLIFIMPAHKKPSFSLPATKPDIDKLCRAVLDGLEGIVYTNDSRVTEIYIKERYAADDQEPGVTITVARDEDDE